MHHSKNQPQEPKLDDENHVTEQKEHLEVISSENPTGTDNNVNVINYKEFTEQSISNCKSNESIILIKPLFDQSLMTRSISPDMCFISTEKEILPSNDLFLTLIGQASLGTINIEDDKTDNVRKQMDSVKTDTYETKSSAEEVLDENDDSKEKKTGESYEQDKSDRGDENMGNQIQEHFDKVFENIVECQNYFGKEINGITFHENYNYNDNKENGILSSVNLEAEDVNNFNNYNDDKETSIPSTVFLNNEDFNEDNDFPSTEILDIDVGDFDIIKEPQGYLSNEETCSETFSDFTAEDNDKSQNCFIHKNQDGILIRNYDVDEIPLAGSAEVINNCEGFEDYSIDKITSAADNIHEIESHFVKEAAEGKNNINETDDDTNKKVAGINIPSTCNHLNKKKSSRIICFNNYDDVEPPYFYFDTDSDEVYEENTDVDKASVNTLKLDIETEYPNLDIKISTSDSRIQQMQSECDSLINYDCTVRHQVKQITDISNKLKTNVHSKTTECQKRSKNFFVGDLSQTSEYTQSREINPNKVHFVEKTKPSEIEQFINFESHGKLSQNIANIESQTIIVDDNQIENKPNITHTFKDPSFYEEFIPKSAISNSCDTSSAHTTKVQRNTQLKDYSHHSFIAIIDLMLLILEGTLEGAFRISGSDDNAIIKNTMYSIRLALEPLKHHFNFSSPECFEPNAITNHEMMEPALKLFMEICPSLNFSMFQCYRRTNNDIERVHIPSYLVTPREVNGMFVYDTQIVPVPAQPPRMPLFSNLMPASSLGAIATADGFIRLNLPYTFQIDFTLDSALCVRNLKDKTAVAISANGKLCGLTSPLSYAFRHGQVVDVHISDEFTRNYLCGKINIRGIHFYGPNLSKNLQLTEQGINISNCELNDMNDSFISDIFFDQSMHGPQYYDNCREVLQSSVKEHFNDQSYDFFINDIKISQFEDGHLTVSRDGKHYCIWAIPEINTAAKHEKGIMRVSTPSCRMMTTVVSNVNAHHKQFFLLNYDNEWICYNTDKMIVTNKYWSADC